MLFNEHKIALKVNFSPKKILDRMLTVTTTHCDHVSVISCDYYLN